MLPEHECKGKYEISLIYKQDIVGHFIIPKKSLFSTEKEFFMLIVNRLQIFTTHHFWYIQIGNHR
jgi:hypothetical protein